MKSRYLLSSIAAALALTGCASNQTLRATNVLVTPPADPITEMRAVAVEARDELRLLAKISDATTAPSLTKEQIAQREFQSVHVPLGFEKISQFAYTGSATKAAMALAQVAGYKFRTLGERQPNEPWVTINVNRLPLNEALKELGVQTGSAMRVEIHEETTPPSMVVVYKK